MIYHMDQQDAELAMPGDYDKFSGGLCGDVRHSIEAAYNRNQREGDCNDLKDFVATK